MPWWRSSGTGSCAVAGSRCVVSRGVTPGRRAASTTSRRRVNHSLPTPSGRTTTASTDRGAPLHVLVRHPPATDHDRGCLDHGRGPRPPRGRRPELGVGRHVDAVDRRSRDHHAGAADPALRAADPCRTSDADALPRAAGAPEEVQGPQRPGVARGHDARDDGAVPEARDEPVLLVPADPRAVTDLLRPVPAPQQPRRDRVGQVPDDRPDDAGRRGRGRALGDLRCTDLRLVLPGGRVDPGEDRDGGADRRDVGDHVHDAEAADAEEHAGVGHAGTDGSAAEDAALLPADHLRRLGRELPDRCPHLLDDDQRLVHGSAVLRDPPQPDSGFRGGAPPEGASRP